MNKNARYLIGLLGMLFGMFYTSQAQDREELKKYIENVIYHDAKVNFNQTPGFIIGLIYGDSTQVYSYGSQSKNEKIPISKYTLFEIGGASKVFTATLVEQLVQAGLMDYDAAFHNYLPNVNASIQQTNFSLLDVVAHRSGLPRMPIDFGVKELDMSNPYAYFSEKDMDYFCKNYRFQESDGKYDYSNLGYALLEKAIENVSQQNYEMALQQFLLEPNQLNQTFLDLDSNNKNLLCKGYSMLGQEAKPWLFQCFHGAAGIKSSMDDLLRLLRLQLDNSTFDGMHQALEKTLVDKNSYAGKGWHIIENKKYFNIVAHSGSTAGHRLFIGFIKETKTGVVVLCNSKNGTNGLGYLLLKLLNNNFRMTPKLKKASKDS